MKTKISLSDFTAKAAEHARRFGCSEAAAGAHLATFYEAVDPKDGLHGFDSPSDYTRAVAETVAWLGCSVSQAINVVNEEAARRG